MVSPQECIGASSSEQGSRVAGLRVVHLRMVMSGLSNSRTRYFNILLSVIQWEPLRASKMATWWEVRLSKVCLRVILDASSARSHYGP